MKAAKLKAESMLEAIGEKIGKPILIQELPDLNDYENKEQFSNSISSSQTYTNYEHDFKFGESLSFTKKN